MQKNYYIFRGVVKWQTVKQLAFQKSSIIAAWTERRKGENEERRPKSHCRSPRSHLSVRNDKISQVCFSENNTNRWKIVYRLFGKL